MRRKATVPSGSVPWNKLELTPALVLPPGLARRVAVADSLAGNWSMPKSKAPMLVELTLNEAWASGLVAVQAAGRAAVGALAPTVPALVASRTVKPLAAATLRNR